MSSYFITDKLLLVLYILWKYFKILCFYNVFLKMYPSLQYEVKEMSRKMSESLIKLINSSNHGLFIYA